MLLGSGVTGPGSSRVPAGSAGRGVRQLRGGRSALWLGHRHPCDVHLQSGASVRRGSGLSAVLARRGLPPCEPGLPGLSVLRGVRLSKRRWRRRLEWPVRGSGGGRQRPQLQSVSCWGARKVSQSRNGKRSLTNAVCRPWAKSRSVAAGPAMHGPVVSRVLPCFRDSSAGSPWCALFPQCLLCGFPINLCQ